MTKVLIDFEKSKDPYSGLGQFCLFLKSNFDQLIDTKEISLEYFIPKKRKLVKLFPFLIPSSDVFHGIHQDTPYLPWKKSTKFVLTIHDFNAIYENSSEVFKTKYLKNLQKKVDRASIVTFISEFTKTEAKKYLNLEGKKLAVIYNGISIPNNSTKPNYIPSKKFLFAIGTVLPKKNFHVLIEMMKYLPDFELVIGGTTFHQYAKKIMSDVDSLKLNDRIHFVQTITNEEKRWYYEKASAFVFPSLLEGFGLPVAEAQSFGLPLFLSKETSLPEIGGPDAFYFDNFEPQSMALKIKASLNSFNEIQTNNLIIHSKKFDWKIAAQKYLEIYKSL